MSRASLPNRKSSGCLELPELLRVSSCLSIKALCLQQSFRMRRRRAAVCSAVAAAPRAISFLRRNGAECLRRLIFLHQPVRNASGGPFFSVLPEKNGEKRGAGERNSAVAPEKLFVSLCVLSFCFRRLNALRAAVGSGFPNARHAVRVVLFTPVEYLTYGIRRVCDFLRLVGDDAHIVPAEYVVLRKSSANSQFLSGRCGHQPLQALNN